VKEPAEADRIFAALSEGGKVGMPIQETFWAQRFGMLTDKFRTNWMVNCEKPMPQGLTGCRKSAVEAGMEKGWG
jgi:PhnB protein